MSETQEPPPSVRRPISALAILGALVLAAGAFCPVVVLPSGESQSYSELAPVDGNIILGAAAVAFVLTWVFRWYRGLFVTSVVALFMIGATLLKVPRAGIGEARLAWGWLVVLAGAVMMLAAALIAEKHRPQPEEPEAPDESEDLRY